ncbi:MAG: DUF3052 domain-containing protein [Balneola sp.]|jgi:hypothetical protein|nr:DUF3052 domain-containing protein [Balneola sp.]MBE77693.1 DUF3052 domain-containing protein [Balneola sp.]|tara:strand:- start:141 stop:548 length:408 start_codon:yes stop_codon:yes gene_type:complete
MAGYSGTPLLKKLGIKPGHSVLIVNEPDHFLELLGDFPDGAELVGTKHPDLIDFIQVFCHNEEELHNAFPPLKSRLAKNGTLWVSWIKKSSKMNTDITGNEVRSLGLQIGLVDVKVCAVDEDWSGLKFMYRKEDR